MQSPKKLPLVLFILDERLSREKAGVLMRHVNTLRRFAQVELLKGATTQDAIVERIRNTKDVCAVFAPWYRYLAWSRVETLLGIARTSGPIFAGYFADQLLPYELEEAAPGLTRALLIDFNNLSSQELITVLRALLNESLRSGITPFLESSTPVHYESWLANQGLGFRLDQVLKIPGIQNTEWRERASSVRLVMTALWTLIYEEGPGKSELSNAVNTHVPHAYFQIAVGERCIALRLCFSQRGWNSRDFVSAFWPNSKRPSSATQTLLRHVDLIRVHPTGEAGDLELTLLFFPSAVAENFSSEFHTLWIDPVSPKSMSEKPYQEASPSAPRLRPLPGLPIAETRDGNWGDAQIKQRDRLLTEAAAAIRKLKTEIQERDETLSDLRSGGVGCVKQSAPPDAESLLNAFENRVDTLWHEIQTLQGEVGCVGDAPLEAEALQRRIEALKAREQSWLKQILQALQRHRRPAA